MEQIKTEHKIFFQASQNMREIENESVDMIVTSPPYPMIEMWDEILEKQNSEIQDNLYNNPRQAFEKMHEELDKVWKECYRVLKDGSFMCINIGDATRTINGDFQLYNNHSRIVDSCLKIGFNNLPNIIWRKQTNAPNKFMGSGMLPCGAYVTLEHEWILIFRKGGKRAYKKDLEKLQRRKSSFFWEERNVWFSDIWEIKGVKQKISNSLTRDRSAAYPLELPYRLINMYSQQRDVVLDPFMGLGTTAIACMISQRNSIGYEIDNKLQTSIIDNIGSYSVVEMNNHINKRYCKHLAFVSARKSDGKEFKHYNKNLSCEVMTSQETDIDFNYLKRITTNTNNKNISFIVEYQQGGDKTQLPFRESSLF